MENSNNTNNMNTLLNETWTLFQESKGRDIWRSHIYQLLQFRTGLVIIDNEGNKSSLGRQLNTALNNLSFLSRDKDEDGNVFFKLAI